MQMAYDPNDPADVALVQGMIDTALEEARDAHETAIAGLKAKNADLLKRLNKARSGDNPDAGEISRLENELDEANGKLSTAESELREVNRKLKKVEGERDTANRQLETESSFSRSMLVENGLTAALTEANVAPQFMEAARALLGKNVTVKVDGDNRSAVGPNDKPLGEFVKEWAASEAGKHYVAAPNNSGGNPPNNGTQGGPGSKKLADLSETERLDLARNNPAEWQRVQQEAGLVPAA